MYHKIGETLVGCFLIFTVCFKANPDPPKNYTKNPQFLLNYYETLSKCGPHGNLILTKFRNEWGKIVDF